VCSKLIEQRNEVQLKWLQNPSQFSGNNPKILREYLGKKGIFERQN
jgi:hypothetical protein